MARRRSRTPIPKAPDKGTDAGSPKTKASGKDADKCACEDETIERTRELAHHAGAESTTVGGWLQNAGKDSEAQIALSLNATRKEEGGGQRVREVSLLRTLQCSRGVPANRFLPKTAPLTAYYAVGAIELVLRRLVAERDAFARKLVQLSEHEATFHQLVRDGADSGFFQVEDGNCIDFNVDKVGPRYVVTRTEPFAGTPMPLLTLWAARVHGESTGDILKTPQEFIFIDPVRKLWWEHGDGVWKAIALKTNVTLVDAASEEEEDQPTSDAIHARFQNEDWEADPIEDCPWPFDAGLRFAKNGRAGESAWKIVDSNGGELVQVNGEDDGGLVYTLGEKTLCCTVKGLGAGILNNFTDFEHRLTDREDYEDEAGEAADDDESDGSSGEYATCDEPAGDSGWCEGCLQKVMEKQKREAKKKKKERRDVKAAATAAKAAKGKKRKANGKSASKAAKKKRREAAATASADEKGVTFASPA